MSALTDEQLMAMFQSGNSHAFQLLFEKYRAAVFNFAWRMIGDGAAAEDLMQDVFLKVVKARDLYEPRARFSTWLFTVVRNHCINHLRSSRYLAGLKTVPVEPADGAEGGEHAHGAADPSVQAQRRELGDRLEAAIGRLPDEYREIFLLRAVEGFSHDEAARILGLQTATARVHYHRARLRLQQDLAGALEEEIGR